MKEPLDTQTYILVIQALEYAKRQGRDPAEVLHVGGLLASKAQVKTAHLETLRYVQRQVASFRPAEFLRMKFPEGRQATPTDMYSCILEYLERLITHAERET